MGVKKEDLIKLQMPETYKKLGIEPRWRVRQVSSGKAFMLAYHDSRDVQKVLDSVCGPENWQNEARDIAGKLYMSVGINVEGEGWVYKSDVGTESNIEKEKGQASDALKRAAVMWGVFRHTYEMGEKVLKASGKFPTTDNGKVLQTGKQQSAYCNAINTEMGNLMSIYNAFKDEFEAHPDAKSYLTGLKDFLTKIKE